MSKESVAPETASVTLPGTVEKVIKSPDPSEPDKAQIVVEGADKLYREIRIDNALQTEKGEIDLSSQLQLFVAGDQDLGIRPERYLKEVGETEFIRRHQAPVRSLAAFEKSGYSLGHSALYTYYRC